MKLFIDVTCLLLLSLINGKLDQASIEIKHFPRSNEQDIAQLTFLFEQQQLTLQEQFQFTRDLIIRDINNEIYEVTKPISISFQTLVELSTVTLFEQNQFDDLHEESGQNLCDRRLKSSQKYDVFKLKPSRFLQLVDLQVNIDTDQKQIRSTLMSNGKHINFQLKENEIIKDSNISFYCHANSHIAPIYSQTLSSSLQQTTSIEQTSENQSIFLTTPISFLTQYSIAFPHIDSQQSSSISDKIRSKEKITYSDIGEGLLIRNKYIWREEDWDDEDEDIEYNGVSALCKSMRNKIGIDPACYAAMMNCEQEKNFLTKTNSLKDDQQFSVAEKTLSEFLMENKYQFAEETISDVRSVALIRVPQQEQQQQINNNKQKNNEFIEEQQQQSIDHYYITFQITAPTEVLGLMRRMAQPEITHSNITIKDNNDDQNLKEQEVEDTELNLEANVQIKNRVEFEGEITVDLDDCTVKIGDNKNSNDKVDISVQNTVSQQSSLKAQINGIEQKDFKWEITLRKKNTEINENESTSQQQLDWDKSQLKCKVSVKTGNNIEDSSDIVSDIDLSKLTIRTAQQQVNNKQPQTKQQKSTSTYEFPISMNCSSHGTPINNGISCICDQGYTSLDSTVKKEYRMCNVVAKTVLDEELEEIQEIQKMNNNETQTVNKNDSNKLKQYWNQHSFSNKILNSTQIEQLISQININGLQTVSWIAILVSLVIIILIQGIFAFIVIKHSKGRKYIIGSEYEQQQIYNDEDEDDEQQSNIEMNYNNTLKEKKQQRNKKGDKKNRKAKLQKKLQ